MELRIKYLELANVINILDKLKAKGLKSIHRTRLSRQLGEELERVGKEQKEIQKEYFELDENDEPIIQDDKCKNPEEYVKTMDEFVNEVVVIDSGDSQVMLRSVKETLEESEIEWDTREAYTYEYLYTALIEDSKDTADENNEN